MYVCICNAVTERQVRECVSSGASSVEELASMIGLGAGCGRCRECAAGLLQELRRRDGNTSVVGTHLIQRLRLEGA